MICQSLKQPSTNFSLNILSFLCVMISFSTECLSQETVIKMGPWEYLYRASPKITVSQTDLEKYPLEVMTDFEFSGELEKDIFRLNHVIVDGTWGIAQGALHQASGRSAALKLGTAKDFELEMGINAEGEGGWYLLYGFKEGQGHGLYNVTLRTSGSPWFISQFARSKGIEASDIEIARYECRGNEPLTVSVIDGKLTAQINRRVLIEDQELPNYEEGDIILGTYDTKYGPKPLKIYGIRLRRPRE
ncbi:hypothetical protein Pan54_10840 [Rubinisphaera italica]|uniref:3-keto-disaccharide hydrolase domain-containing protein n=2 Tax=Rubinisphaera italica TaxID=2527969 RepID=A0A5C5XBI0_9PLAN|nr:hypothetical protein Pan54_10840 [Rubinisphaera italica]